MNKSPFYIIGNWKSNKTVTEASIWCQDFATAWKKQKIDESKIKIVLCPSFIHLTTVRSLIELSQVPIELGCQTISSTEMGAFTGEVAASMVSEFVRFVLIGHSERRTYQKETETELLAKVVQAKAAGIEPIYCVQNSEQSIPPQCMMVAYEPVWAIGTGKADTPQNANEVAAVIKQKATRPLTIIYGGSVTAANIAGYAATEHINGVLPGGASLTATTFVELIANVSSV